MTEVLLIWGQHNTGQQKTKTKKTKQKNESEGQDVPHIPNSAISFERHNNQIAGIFALWIRRENKMTLASTK